MSRRDHFDAGHGREEYSGFREGPRLNPLMPDGSDPEFHEMSREEFEALPGTFFHGHPTGNFNWSTEGRQGFHVGTHRAAEEAVTARSGNSGKPVVYGDGTVGGTPFPYSQAETKQPNGMIRVEPIRAHPEQIRGGRIVSPMVNSPGHLGSYGSGLFGMFGETGDSLANGRVSAIKTRGQTMRQGIYYKNAAEDIGSVSAVLPTRQSFKTHEDYLVEARAAGKRIPSRALEGYTQIPGQQRLF